MPHELLWLTSLPPESKSCVTFLTCREAQNQRSKLMARVGAGQAEKQILTVSKTFSAVQI